MERNYCIDNGAAEKEIPAKVEDNEHVVRKPEVESMDFEPSSNECPAVVIKTPSSSQCNRKPFPGEPEENNSSDINSEQPMPSTFENSAPITKRSKMEEQDESLQDKDLDESSVTSSSSGSNSDSDSDYLESDPLSAEDVANTFRNTKDAAVCFKKLAAITSTNAKRSASAVKPFVEMLRTIASVAGTIAEKSSPDSKDWTTVAEACTSAADSYVAVMDAMDAAAEAILIPTRLPKFSHSQ